MHETFLFVVNVDFQLRRTFKQSVLHTTVAFVCQSRVRVREDGYFYCWREPWSRQECELMWNRGYVLSWMMHHWCYHVQPVWSFVALCFTLLNVYTSWGRNGWLRVDKSFHMECVRLAECIYHPRGSSDFNVLSTVWRSCVIFGVEGLRSIKGYFLWQITTASHNMIPQRRSFYTESASSRNQLEQLNTRGCCCTV